VYDAARATQAGLATMADPLALRPSPAARVPLVKGGRDGAPDAAACQASRLARLQETSGAENPEVGGELAAMVGFVIEVPARDDPPDGYCPAEPVVVYQRFELGSCKASKELAPAIAECRKAANERIKMGAIRNCGRTPLRLDAPELGIGQFPEQPFIALDEMLRDVGEAQRILGGSPVLAAYRY
jgi:hypothetical protein